MKRRAPGDRPFCWAVPALGFALLCAQFCSAQAGAAQAGVQGRERTFSQPKAAVEKVLNEMQSSLSGRLPVLDGFAIAQDHPFDRYQRAFYQSTVQLVATASGGTLVRVKTKVTAWYADPVPARSGYQLLTSNGRLEADLLDQLADQLAAQADTTASAANRALAESAASAQAASGAPASSPAPVVAEPAISAPMPRIPELGGTFSSSVAQSLATQEHNDSPFPQKNTAADPAGLKAEAENLEEILKNQGHPRNLVAVKKPGTPVVASPSLNAKTLFLASAHDEFEMLEFNPNWVHVRISGLSRGWIWRNNVEMPDSIPDNPTQAGPAPASPAAELFRVSREETAQFPGDWEPLRGKNVKIVSVQKVDESAKDAGLALKLEFAKALLDKNYTDLAPKPADVAGIVVIFDSADGGMIAATRSTLQQWKAGALSDAALWHQCFFDPPETLGSSTSTASH